MAAADSPQPPAEEAPAGTPAAQVLSLLKGDQVEADQLAAIVERDPAFAGQVMQLAKSIIYNPAGQPTEDLAQAIRRLGQRRIGEMAHALEDSAAETATAATAG
jgi:HD-like signal output (HDOD) protein